MIESSDDKGIEEFREWFERKMSKVLSSSRAITPNYDTIIDSCGWSIARDLAYGMKVKKYKSFTQYVKSLSMIDLRSIIEVFHIESEELIDIKSTFVFLLYGLEMETVTTPSNEMGEFLIEAQARVFKFFLRYATSLKEGSESKYEITLFHSQECKPKKPKYPRSRKK